MDRQVRGLGALENHRGVGAVLTVGIGDTHTVAQQSAGDRVFTKLVDGGKPLARRESDDPVAPRVEIGIGCDQQRPDAIPNQRCERGLQCLVTAGSSYDDTLAGRTCRLFELLQLMHGRRKVRIDERTDQRDARRQVAEHGAIQAASAPFDWSIR